MGHYASDMDYTKVITKASWFELKVPYEVDDQGHGIRNYPYSLISIDKIYGTKDLVAHDPCGQVFHFKVDDESDTTRAVAHHNNCPLVKE